jgi:RHS repeat-associated protein
MTYDYDQLNRINKMESWQDKINKTTSFTWTRTAPDTKWREDIKYDPNGNILTYKRKDQDGNPLDDLTYNYTKVNGDLKHNQLNAVTEAHRPQTTYPDDIEADNNEFTYDQIGNLSFDKKLNTNFSWTVYGKMNSAFKTVNSGSLSQETGSNFGYDAQQNRYKKDNYSREENALAQTTTEKHDINYYIRDAQGNILAIYNKQHNFTTHNETGLYTQQLYGFNQKEQHLYGSSRLGIVQLDRPMSAMSFNASDLVTQNQGVRNYELNNHLGNVLSTITDKGVITSAQDYYPFGLTLASRSFTEGGSVYRYSFNGKEDDKETGLQDYGMRLYFKKLGRFLSVDPIGRQFPELTPYQFASNTPIMAIDLDGLEKWDVTGNNISIIARYAVFTGRSAGGNVINATSVINQSKLHWADLNVEMAKRTYKLDISANSKGEVTDVSAGKDSYVVQYDITVESFVDENDPKFIAFSKSSEFGGVYVYGNTTYGGQTSPLVSATSEAETKPILTTRTSFRDNKEVIFFKSEAKMTATPETHEVGHTLGLGHFTIEPSLGQKYVALGEALLDPRIDSGTAASGEKYNGIGLMRGVFKPIDRPTSSSVLLETQLINILNSNPGEKKK